MEENVISRMKSMEERIHELDRGFARLILDLERRMRTLSETAQNAPQASKGHTFGSSALSSIVISCLPAPEDSPKSARDEILADCESSFTPSCEGNFTEMLEASALSFLAQATTCPGAART
ncbi:MAG: hypothetical protein LBW85_04525 [Deltaproteobacteria bacterium]|jgi:hypothetical protein|nr:hypothetical protein [Deltaproteobacteria bacterium]